MTVEEHKRLARRYYQEVLNERNDAPLAELFAESFVIHPPDGSSLDLDRFREDIARYRSVFPDYQVTIEDQVAEGDKVVTRWTALGTHRGALGKLSPTGRRVRVSAIHIDRMQDGKIVERWEQFDLAGLLRQLNA